MNDIECLDFYDKNIKGKRFHKTYLIKMYPDFMEYIQNRFSNTNGNESVKELIYRIRCKIEEIPKCPICGKQVKFINLKNTYQTFCTRECQLSEEGQKIQAQLRFNTKLEKYGNGTFTNSKKAKQTCLEKYGVTNVGAVKEIRNKVKDTCLKKYGVDNVIKDKTIKNKVKETCLKKFGSETPFESNEIQDKVKKTCIEKYGVKNIMQLDETKEKIKQTCIEKYGVEYSLESKEVREKIKKTNIKRYGVEIPIQNKDICKKAFETHYKNQNNRDSVFSKKENEIYNYLISIDKDTKRQYYTKEYPFHCDFYLPKFNVYIEYNGMWTHGKHPFNKDSNEDIKLLEIWKKKAETSKFYKSAINIWTISDPLKRKTAKINNLNYLEIFHNYNNKLHYIDEINNYLNNLNEN